MEKVFVATIRRPVGSYDAIRCKLKLLASPVARDNQFKWLGQAQKMTQCECRPADNGMSMQRDVVRRLEELKPYTTGQWILIDGKWKNPQARSPFYQAERERVRELITTVTPGEHHHDSNLSLRELFRNALAIVACEKYFLQRPDLRSRSSAPALVIANAERVLRKMEADLCSRLKDEAAFRLRVCWADAPRP